MENCRVREETNAFERSQDRSIAKRGADHGRDDDLVGFLLTDIRKITESYCVNNGIDITRQFSDDEIKAHKQEVARAAKDSEAICKQ